MWSLRERQNGELFLTYDKTRRFTNNLRGIWEYVGPASNAYTQKCITENSNAGLWTVFDDEGGVRVLILED